MLSAMRRQTLLKTPAALLCGVALSIAAFCGPARAAQTTDSSGLEFYEKKIRPVFVQQCYKCHSTTADKLKAGLYLDSREGILKGGETGPAVVPGHPEQSLLIEAVRYTNQDVQMPPKNRLPAAVVADFVTWVQLGAPAPVGASRPTALATTRPTGPQAEHNLAGIPYDALRHDHWAWQPVKVAAAPAVKNTAWPRSDIDHFILASLEAKGLHPVGDADRVTLIRRVTFDLTGLPPTLAETQAFVSDPSSNAFEKVVDRLLASPAFGERWGRHWLDVARYAESTGSARNVPYSYAWRYRDYVIDAFNKDKPYNRFLTEQLAGDLLPAANPAQHDEQLVATGFLALGIKDLNEKDRLKYTMDNVDEQIDVTSRSMLGMTVSCARCHDHKFDPIPTTDYYALAGIFRSTEILAGVHGRKGGAGKDYEAPNLLVHLDKATNAAPVALSAAMVSRPADPGATKANAVADLSAKVEKATDELRAIRAEMLAQGGKIGGAAVKAQFRPRLVAKRQEIASLTEQLDALQNGTGKVPSAAVNTVAPAAGGLAVGVRDAAPVDAQICIHGDTDNLGPEVPRGFVNIFHEPSQPSIDSAHSGRLELAEWITSPQNPLTGRVMVNRIWLHLFGNGLVRTPDNFGTTGEAPSHPELLDYLAAHFESAGWSVKQTIRSIVLTHAYQLASTYDQADAMADPGDRMVWRMSPRRLEAESIRDAMLAASGQLTLTPAQGSPVMTLPVAELRKKGNDSGIEDTESTHRSVYLPIVRELVPPVLDLFDFAEPTLVTGNRDVTTVPTQALFLMNNPFVLDQSRRLADKVLAAPRLDDAGRVDMVYRLALCRPPTPTETARALQYTASYARDDSTIGNAKAGTNPKTDAWASLCQALFCSAEFRYLN
jgi:cytochrome c553